MVRSKLDLNCFAQFKIYSSQLFFLVVNHYNPDKKELYQGYHKVKYGHKSKSFELVGSVIK